MIKYQIEFWKHLAKEEISDENFYIFTSGIPTSVLNLVILKKQNLKNALHAIEVADEFFTKLDTPWGINIIEDQSSDAIITKLEEQGFKQIVMQHEINSSIKSLTSDTKLDNNSDVKIIEVLNEEELNQWILPISDAFEATEQETTLYLDIIKKAFNRQENRLKHFILYDKHQLVGSATLGLFDDVARLDNIATLKSKQRNGYGKKIVQYCMKKASRNGAKRMIFESSEAAINLYRKLGFSDTSKSYIYSKNQITK